jgi:hypothetical protein
MTAVRDSKQKALDDLSHMKMESERDKALRSQQIEFQEEKIKQL